MGASSSSAVDDTGSTDGHVIIGSNADGGSKETGLDVGVSTDTIAVDVTSPSLGFQGFSSPNKVEPCKDQCKCTHPYLNKWDGGYLCMDCWCKLNDTAEAMEKHKDRLAEEAELEKNTPVDVVEEGQSVGSMSAARGVSIGWLLAFTKLYNCYEWNSWDIIRKILKPATEERRCRVVELPEMARFVGPAKTFISYAQAGKWGDLVAAIADGGADLDRCVWIDLFAIRQWPSDKPDLDFASTIEHCSSFMVVCSYQKEVQAMDFAKVGAGEASIYDLDMSVKRQICFARVWCLVEAHKACTMPDTPYMMKVGHHVLGADGSLEFIPAPRSMLDVLYCSVDVEKAEATVVSDKQRIIDGIVAGVGVAKLNSTIRGAINAAMWMKNSIVQCAACGDADAIKTVLADPKSIFDVSNGGFVNLLKALLDSDIITDIDRKEEDDEVGGTALINASCNGHESCVRLLLEAGADKEARSKSGGTALMIASAEGHESCVRVLLASGADKDAVNNGGATALTVASENGHDSIVQVLVEAGADTSGLTLVEFMKAAKSGDESRVQDLLESGVDIEVRGANGFTALMNASDHGRESCVRLLLQAGADVHAKSSHGSTALTCASESGHEACVRALLETGADVHASDNDGDTALACASLKGHESTVRVLLEAGADKDVKDNAGNTALIYASMFDHESCVRALLEAGADKEAKEKDGKTALILASEKGNEAVVTVLRGSE